MPVRSNTVVSDAHEFVVTGTERHPASPAPKAPAIAPRTVRLLEATCRVLFRGDQYLVAARAVSGRKRFRCVVRGVYMASEVPRLAGDDRDHAERACIAAVPHLPGVSNATDLEPLARARGVRVSEVPVDASLADASEE